MLNAVRVTVGVLLMMLVGRDKPELDPPSSGNSLMIHRGLSSIGPILVETIEFRWVTEALLSAVDRNDDDPTTVTLPCDEEVNECLFR